MFAAAVAGNPHTPPEVLTELFNVGDPTVCANAAANPNLPQSSRAATHSDWTVRLGAAKSPNLPAETALTLLADDTELVRFYAAGNPNLPADVLVSLFIDRVPAAGGNADSAPAAILDTLSGLAGNGNVAESVKQAIAANPNTSAEVLARLLDRADPHVRRQAAGNPNTPPDVLATLATSLFWTLRKAAAANPNLPTELLRALTNDDVAQVREAAAANLNLPARLLNRSAKSSDAGLRIGAAANPNLPGELLRRLAGDHPGVREALAGNPNLPPDVLARLAEDGSWVVRAAAAANPNLDIDALVRLTGDYGSFHVYECALHALAARLAVPAKLRGADVGTLAKKWLAAAGLHRDEELRTAAVCAVPDPGVRTGHILAYGPEWEQASARFGARYGDLFQPAERTFEQSVRTRRRAARAPRQPAQSWA